MFKGFETIKDIPKNSKEFDPKPFPGRYPTRVAYAVVLPGKKTVQYIGKPSVDVWKRILAIQRQGLDIKGCFWEFDQGTLVRMASFGMFEGWVVERALVGGAVEFGGLRHRQVSQLLNYYYPQGQTFVKFEPIEVQNWRLAPGDKKTTRVYATGSTPRAAREQWRGWLSGMKGSKKAAEGLAGAKKLSILDVLEGRQKYTPDELYAADYIDLERQRLDNDF